MPVAVMSSRAPFWNTMFNIDLAETVFFFAHVGGLHIGLLGQAASRIYVPMTPIAPSVH